MAKTKLHYNLNRGGWSVTPPKSKVQPAVTAYAVGVDVKQPSGKAFDACLTGSARAVFAWFKCDRVDIDSTSVKPDNAEQVFFNPKKGDTFFHVYRNNQKVRVDHMRQVWAQDNRQLWAIV